MYENLFIQEYNTFLDMCVVEYKYCIMSMASMF